MFDLISMIRSTLRKLPWLSFAEQRLHYTCLHTFVTAGRISFNVDIFPLVIVFVFHLNSIFNFCLAHFREISDLITAACIPTQSTVKQFILVYKLYCREQRRKLTTFSRVIQTDLFQRSITQFSMKRREINSRFCGLLNLEIRNFRYLVDPCVFPVCSAYKVVHYSEYQNFSRVSSAHFDFF